ncbi:MAG: type II toxin-antitoxin system HipA family toxin, partial [Demequina sp.]
EYRNAALTRQHLVDEIASWHVRGADEIVYQALEEILVATESESPLEGAGPGLQGHVVRVTKALLGHGTAGDAAR